MKVVFNSCVSSMSGRMGDLVFYRDKKTGKTYAREYVVPALTQHNHDMGNIAKNLGVFYHALNPDYISDIKDYTDRRNLITLGAGNRQNCYSIFTKLMHNLANEFPIVDLHTVTPQFIVDNALPLRTIAEAVESHLLDIVQRYEELDNWIV